VARPFFETRCAFRSIMPIRLVIADADPSMLRHIEELGSRHREFEIVASVTTGNDALHAVRQLQPDILLLDIHIAAVDAPNVLRRMQRARSRTQAVILIEVEGDDVIDAVRLGARGVIHKAVMPTLIVECIREVHDGKKWLERGHVTRVLDQLVKRETGLRELSALLTRRQIDVVQMVAKGLDDSALAKELLITQGTAKLHLHKLYEKLNVGGRAELVQFLHSKGLP
jgi:DNA-binding NarL/FixJ family response regulator